VRPVLETNSIAALVLAVAGGALCCIVPGALAATAPAGLALEAQPLVRPALGTPVGFFTLADATPSSALEAALALAQSPGWRRDVQGHAGRLASFKH
jgi:DNA-binding transcriptional LysR family regulator